ncbi:Crp/Fnr family transcriptional regulator [Evansella clarkii]|uniref:Crp/Fnr family transcriptional regulator n=1 Tax=Evansella clarkii TaxID=79879 RepID=UPI0009968369|nr:Crp/Fnr family transcriptional regulator [Evansella clarkii]
MFDWSPYLDHAEKRSLKKGKVLFRQGDVLNGFYFLNEGKVMISVLREDGYDRIIDLVFPDTLLGEQLIDGNTSFTTATLLMDSTLYYFSKERFESLTEQYPEVSREFSCSLIKKLRMLAKINSMKNAPIDIQLAHFLLNLREKKRQNALEVEQKLISNYIGKSRVAVWKVLKDWRLRNIVVTSGKTFIIKDIEALREIESAVK